jgi:hypothetical protein
VRVRTESSSGSWLVAGPGVPGAGTTSAHSTTSAFASSVARVSAGNTAARLGSAASSSSVTGVTGSRTENSPGGLRAGAEYQPDRPMGSSGEPRPVELVAVRGDEHYGAFVAVIAEAGCERPVALTLGQSISSAGVSSGAGGAAPRHSC